MSKKILINGITFELGNLVPLLLKIKYWQHKGCRVTFFGNNTLRKRIDELKIIKEYNFIDSLSNCNIHKSRLWFIFWALKRNVFNLFYLKRFKNRFDIIYSISSVLDLIIFPYFLKIFDKKIKWAVVLDNIVPLLSRKKIFVGDLFIRLLAWFFFQLSLVFLKRADYIFVIKPELKDYLLNKGFINKKIFVTSNGVEVDLIYKAKKKKCYNIDALFIGRINEAKGIYDMLKVVSVVKKKLPKFQLAIMGRGDEKTEKIFKNRIRQMRLDDNIQFLGYKTGQDKFDIIKSSKFFLFLSETESFPIALLEIVCSGIKAFVYDLDAYAMYKNNELTIFQKNDYQAVVKGILNLFISGDFENHDGKLLLNKYSWDKVARIELRAMSEWR